MKKAIFFTAISLTMLSVLGCRSSDFSNPVITIQFDLQTQAVNPNATKSGESFDFTRDINLRDTFVKRYNIDPDKLETFVVESLIVAFNKDNCDKLSTYEISVSMPGLTPFSFPKSIIGCSLPKYLSQYPTILTVDKATTNLLLKPIVTTDYANSIKAGNCLLTRFKMTAGQDIAAGESGILIYLSTKATYRP